MNILKIKRLLLMLTLLVGAASAASADTFSVKELSIAPGQTADLEFTLSNLTPFYGFQLDIQLPSGLEFVKDSNNKADITRSSTRLGSYQLVSNLTSANSVKLGAFSPTHTPISGTSGVLFTAKVQASTNFTGGPVSVSNIKFTNGSDNDVALSNATVNVTKAAAKVTAITLSNSTLDINVGKTATLTVASVTPDYADNKAVTWSSSNTSVATVSNAGVVTGVSEGKATITATAADGSGVKATCEVTVSTIPVTGISLSSTSCEIFIGSSQTLTATVTPSDATNKNITWSTDKPAVATVENGVVKAVGVGEATITATAADGSGVKVSCAVTVKPILVNSITLSETQKSCQIGNGFTLAPTISPTNATNKTVTWKSSDETVATVDAKGNVTPRKVGKTNITVTAQDGSGVSATCAVTVVETPAESVTLNQTTASLKVAETVRLTATVLPETTTDKTVIWTSDKPEIAKVENGLVTALAPGEATITASCGSATATCAVKVTKIDVTNVTLNKTALTLSPGGKEQLTATVVPDNATYKTVTWTTSDAAVATVGADGTVTAVKAGNATITATADGVSATASVKVMKAPESLTAILANPSIKQGETTTLTVSLSTAENFSYKGLQFNVTLPDGVTVESSTFNSALPATCVKAFNTSNNPAAVIITAVGEEIKTLSEILTITLKASETAALGDKTISISGIKLSYGQVNNTLPDASTTLNVIKREIPVTGITLSSSAVSILKGNEATITATVTPADATNQELEWSVDDSSIISLSANGKSATVTGLDLGEATVTVRAKDGSGVSATATVRVNPVPAEKVAITGSVTELKVNGTTQLTATVSPEETTYKEIEWSSSDNTKATVSATGLVTAVGLGDVTITATVKATPSVTATYKLTVVPTPAESINITGNVTELKVNGTTQLTATVSPEETTYKEIEWSSSDNTKATVSANGYVTAVALGDVTITAKVKATPTVTATYKLTVVPTPAESITLSGTELTTLKERETNQLTAKVSPDDTTYPEIVWSTSNEKVATVSADGLVTAVAAGSVTITATVKATPTVSADYSLTVKALLLGDSNEDSEVDVFDAVNVAKYINGENLTRFCFVASDVIWDNEINIADVTGITNLAIGLPIDHQPSRVASRGPVANGGRFIAGEARLTADGNIVIPVAMTSDAKLSSLQANVILPEGMDVISVKTTAAAADHSLIYNVTDDGVLRIVLFSFDNTLLAADSKALFEIAVDANGREGEMIFDNILAATPGCALYRLEAEPFHFNTPTSVDDLTGDRVTVRPVIGAVEILNAAGLEVTVLDIQGRVIKQFATATDRELFKLASGFYIIKVGNDAFKVNVK